jgi:hypothetical protein
MQDEEGLVAQGLLPDVNFCRHALSLGDRLPSAAHLQTCAVCLRRWRVTEAALQGWQPMTHRSAAARVRRMAAAFGSLERDEVYRAFYAHLADCRRCESALAALTFDLQPARSRRPPEADGSRLAVMR